MTKKAFGGCGSISTGKSIRSILLEIKIPLFVPPNYFPGFFEPKSCSCFPGLLAAVFERLKPIIIEIVVRSFSLADLAI